MAQTIFSRHRQGYPRYPSILPEALWAIANRLLGRHLSFGATARRLFYRISPPVVSRGTQNIPPGGGFVVMVNHYTRENFNTSMFAIALSALIPSEVTWVMSDEWVFQGHPFAFVLRPIMRFILASLNDAYGFLAMPTMVPGYSETSQRGAAVRRVINYVRTNQRAVIGIAPEGRDSPEAGIGELPTGVGKFILYLNRLGLPILPVGITEDCGQLSVCFGEPYNLVIAEGESDVDEQARAIVRERISRLLKPVISG